MNKECWRENYRLSGNGHLMNASRSAVLNVLNVRLPEWWREGELSFMVSCPCTLDTLPYLGKRPSATLRKTVSQQAVLRVCCHGRRANTLRHIHLFYDTRLKKKAYNKSLSVTVYEASHRPPFRNRLSMHFNISVVSLPLHCCSIWVATFVH